MLIYYTIRNSITGRYVATIIGNIRRFPTMDSANRHIERNKLSDVFEVRVVRVIDKK